jgi:hypothetical protein
MTHTHTPAPWSDSGHDGKGNLIVESGYGSICAVWRVNGYGCQVADARLIAAAPEMLAALKDAEFLLRKAGLMAGPMRDSFNRSASDAKEAIAKAEGNA